MRKILFHALAACLLTTVTARASTNVFAFNEDPASILTIFKGEEANSVGFAGAWFATDGSTLEAGTNPSTNGYLQITGGDPTGPGAFGHRAAIIFDDFDNGLVISGFKFQCDLRIGAGTANPADGFSLNYARGNDPVIANNDGSGFAASPGGEANLPEEGTTTGLSICFDAWDSGSGDVVGLTIRVDDVIRTNFALPTRNGDCTDPTSMQTGTNTLGLAGLCWQPLSAQLTPSGLLHVSYKGVALLTNYAVNFAPSPGRLIFAGRVGGSNQRQHVDNIRLETTPSAAPVVGPTTGNGNGFKFTISDSGAATPNTNTITVSLDGAPVAASALVQSGNIGGGNGITTVVYQNTSLVLEAGSQHTNIVQFTGTGFSGTVTATNVFTVPAYNILAESDKAPGTVNTSLLGFSGRIHQLPVGRQPGNSAQRIAKSEKHLVDGYIDPGTGLPYVSIAGLSTFTDVDVINWAQDFPIGGAGQGNFSLDRPAPFNTSDEPIPGIDANVNPNTDNFTLEVLTILNLPVGAYELGVNHDDNYRVSVGPEPRDLFRARVIASNNNNADNTGIRIVVTNGGFYPMRVVMGEDGGGSQLEIYSVDFVTGQKVLINNAADPLSITSYSDTAALTHPYLVYTIPYQGLNGQVSTNPIVAKFQDGAAGTVLDASIRIDDQVPTIVNNGAETTASLLVSTQTFGIHTAKLVYSTSLGGPFTNTWSYDVFSTKTDVTQPGDPIEAYSTLTTTSPDAEGVTNIIANNLQKYLRFNNNVTISNHAIGFVVTPSVGPTVVTGLRHFVANDAIERDPAIVVLEGSVNGGASWNTIFSGPVTVPTQRNGGGATEANPNDAWLSEVAFPNTHGFSSYRWYLTHIRGNATLMQIAEVELLGTTGTLAATLSFSASGGNITITPSQTGTLQASPTLTGWTNVGPISGPLVLPTTAPALFYRLQVP